MAFNHVENVFLGNAMEELEGLYRNVYPEYRGKWGLGIVGIDFMVVCDGKDRGKLTVCKPKQPGSVKYEPDPNITPVDCYNLLSEGESMASAVERVYTKRGR